MRVTYSENNSGGEWWLTKQNYEALYDAGWIAMDYESPLSLRTRDGFKRPYEVYRDGLTMFEAIAEWEELTGLDSSALGCYSCCGPPHSFHDDQHNYYSPEPVAGTRWED